MKLQNRGVWRGLRPALTAGLLVGALTFVLPLALVERPADGSDGMPSQSGVSQSQDADQPSDPAGEGATGWDEANTVRLLMDDGTVEERTMADYLWSVTAAEMPASFEPDALKAQAVCARTYALWKSSRTDSHDGADLCTQSSCCQAYIDRDQAMANWGDQGEEYQTKISAALSATDGVVAVYDGQAIQAVFFSSASGATEDAAAVWGSALPYLVSVESPEGDEVPGYRSTVTYTAQEVRDLVLAAYPGADLSGAASQWFSNVTYTASGRVSSVDVGGVTLSGGAARTLFSLRSACFQIEMGEDAVTFSVTGYGHGVGLSQYGANAMAQEGTGWQDILYHYYTGISLVFLGRDA